MGTTNHMLHPIELGSQSSLFWMGSHFITQFLHHLNLMNWIFWKVAASSTFHSFYFSNASTLSVGLSSHATSESLEHFHIKILAFIIALFFFLYFVESALTFVLLLHILVTFHRRLQAVMNPFPQWWKAKAILRCVMLNLEGAEH